MLSLKRLATVLLCLCTHQVFSQIGGKSVFEFLNLSPNTLQSALGGLNISADPQNAAIFMANPALMDKNSGRLQMDFMPFYADITYLMATYRHDLDFAKMGVGVQYVSYGNFDRFDATGQKNGSFSANDYALNFAISHQIAPFSMGINLKWVGSTLDNYSAMGFLADLGGSFVHPKKDLKIGLVIKNLGFAVSNYTAAAFQMPFDVQAGISFKLEKMPFRISLTAHHLHRFDLAYLSPNRKNSLDANGNPIEEKIGFADEFFRHIVIGTELLFHKNFNLRFGYNFMQRAELALPDAPALVGFSFGGLIRIKDFEICISRSLRHIAGGTTSFSVSMDTQKFFRKKRIIE